MKRIIPHRTDGCTNVICASYGGGGLTIDNLRPDALIKKCALMTIERLGNEDCYKQER